MSPASPPRRSRRRRDRSPTDNSTPPTKRRATQPPPPGPMASSSSASQPQPQNNEEIHEDDLCPICRLLLYRPVTTRCSHTLCKSCMAHWADVSISSQMTIVDIDEEPVAFDAVSELEAMCPMCRTHTTASLDHDRAGVLRQTYPTTWAEREVEETYEIDEEEGIQTLTVYVGNRHRWVESDDANRHEWTFFVKPSRTDIVEEVQLQLHQTFEPNRIIRQRAPYEVRRLGWGYFVVMAYVILKAGYSWVSEDARDSPDGAVKGMLPLQWLLDFTGFGGRGSMGRCRLKVKKDKNDWEDVSSEDERDNREWQRTMRTYQQDGLYVPPAEE